MRGSGSNLVAPQHAPRPLDAGFALVETDNQFRLLVNSVVDYAIYVLDPNGLVMTWNLGAERIKGYTADEIVGCHFGRFYAIEDRMAGIPAHCLKKARRDGRFETEGWRIRKDGTRFWASVVIETIHSEDGLLLGFTKVTRDITERCQAQIALRESEPQFHLLVNGVTDYALYMLDRDGIVTSWNTGAQRIKGYTADEIIGQHFSQVWEDEEIYLGLSIGIAMAPGDGTSTEELLSNADLAVYQPKAGEQSYSSLPESGFSLFRPCLRDAARARRTCEQ